jgi:hypothetical protein
LATTLRDAFGFGTGHLGWRPRSVTPLCPALPLRVDVCTTYADVSTTSFVIAQL